MKAHYCFLHQKLKCSCSPFCLFSIYEILLHSHCCLMYRFLKEIFCPFTLFKMPHKSKGSSSRFVSKTQGVNSFMKVCELCFLGVVHSCPSGRGGEEDAGGSRKKTKTNKKTPHKEVAFSQQHSQLKNGGRARPLLVSKNVVFSLFEKANAGQCSNSNLPYQSHASLLLFLSPTLSFSFLCVPDTKRRRRISESDWSASLLAWSPRQCPHTRHQHFVYSPTCHALFVSPGNASTHKHTADSHSLLEVEGRVEERMERREASFLMWCTAKCWVHVKAKPTVSFKSQ